MQTIRTNTQLRIGATPLALIALLMLGGQAVAGGQAALPAGSGGLVPGAAPVPEFHLNFLLQDSALHGLPPLAHDDNLEIALTSPDSGVFRFLFSPRPQFGLSLDKFAGNRGYAALTWNVFDSGSVFGNLGIAGTYDANAGTPADPLHRPLGPSVLLHGALELGYHIGAQHSLSLSLDQTRAPEFKLNAETTDNLRLRYGLKF